MNITYAASALRDLDDIDAWISQGDPDRAINFVRELQSAADDLVDGPLRFPLLDANRYPDVHRRNHGSYRIPDRVTGADILILHVHHGRRSTPEL